MSDQAITLTAEQFAELEATQGGRLLSYRELAGRLGLGERTVKELKAARMITPVLAYGSNVVRFHWPSVIAELEKKAPAARKGR
jgi:DNA-binding transcriptional regulator YhcF (GntR family)